jgi:DNA modification methylase
MIGDVREKLAELPDESVHCVVTSPPYFGLRDYGVAGQIGLEPTPAEFVAVMVEVFRDVRRVLRKDGTLWLNLGDSYAAMNRGENARPRAETLTGIQVGNPHADIRTRKEVIDGQRDAGIKPKDLLGIPWRVAFALQADGWYLRQDIIWSKPNPMPESVTDRCTKAHEYLFLLSKSARYHFDAEAISEPILQSSIDRFSQPNLEQQEGSWRVPGKTNGPMKAKRRKPQGWNTSPAYHNADPRYAPREESEDYVAPVEKDRRNRRSVWTVATQPFDKAHFATFPPALIEPCIKAGCPKGGVVLDPFGGAGTTGLVADRLGRDAILIELNPEYAEMARNRIHSDGPMFADVEAA